MATCFVKLVVAMSDAAFNICKVHGIMFNTMSCSTCYVVSNNSKTDIANKDEAW